MSTFHSQHKGRPGKLLTTHNPVSCPPGTQTTRTRMEDDRLSLFPRWLPRPAVVSDSQYGPLGSVPIRPGG